MPTTRSKTVKGATVLVWGVCRGKRGYYETQYETHHETQYETHHKTQHEETVNFKYHSFDYKRQRSASYATNVSEGEVVVSKFQYVHFNTTPDMARVVEPMLRDTTIEKGKPFYIPVDVDDAEGQTIVEEGTEPEAGCKREYIAVKATLQNRNRSQNQAVVNVWTVESRPVEKDKYLKLSSNGEKREAPTCSEVKNGQTEAFVDLVKRQTVDSKYSKYSKYSKCKAVFTIDSPLGEAFTTYVKLGVPAEDLTVLSREPLPDKTFRGVARRYSETELSFFLMNAKRTKLHFDLDVTQNAETVAAEFLLPMQDGWFFCGQVLRITYSIRKMKGKTDVASVERHFHEAVAKGGFELDVRCHERYLNENSRPLGFLLAVVRAP